MAAMLRTVHEHDCGGDALLTLIHGNVPAWLATLEGIAQTVRRRRQERALHFETRTSISSCFELVFLANGDLQKIVTPPTSNQSIKTPSFTPLVGDVQKEVVGCDASAASSVVGYARRAQQALSLDYDGDTQLFLSTLHNDLAIARNIIRRRLANIPATRSTQTRTSFGWSPQSLDTSDEESEMRNLLARIKRRRRPAVRNMIEVGLAIDTASAPLTRISAKMGRVQDLCHLLAYGLLKDDDCLVQVSQAMRELRVIQTWSFQERSRLIAMRLVADVGGGSAGSSVTLHDAPVTARRSVRSDLSMWLESSEEEDERKYDWMLPPSHAIPRTSTVRRDES